MSKWQKGQTGNAGGRPKDKWFTDEIRKVCCEETGPKTKRVRKLNRIAQQVVDAAMKGEPWACNMVADRLDGKPATEGTLTIDDKRDSTDWRNNELAARLVESFAGDDSEGIADAGTGDAKPDKVH